MLRSTGSGRGKRTQEVEEKIIKTQHILTHVFRQHGKYQGYENKAHRDLDGKADFHDVHLRRGSGHERESQFDKKQRRHDRPDDFQGQGKEHHAQRPDLAENSVAEKQPARRNVAERLGKGAEPDTDARQGTERRAGSRCTGGAR